MYMLCMYVCAYKHNHSMHCVLAKAWSTHNRCLELLMPRFITIVINKNTNNFEVHVHGVYTPSGCLPLLQMSALSFYMALSKIVYSVSSDPAAMIANVNVSYIQGTCVQNYYSTFTDRISHFIFNGQSINMY